MMFLYSFSEFWSDVKDVFGELVELLLNALWISLCGIVYPIISWLYAVFAKISTADLLSKLELQDIINRFTVIFTIVMTFYITFEVVKYTVSPDTIVDKQKGASAIIGRIVISILLLALFPSIFTYTSRIQSAVIKSNVIGKIVLNYQNEADYEVDRLGRTFTGTLFGAFLTYTCDNESECNEMKDKRNDAIDIVKSTGTVAAGLPQTVNLIPGRGLDFHGLLALFFGCFVLYVMFLYCKDIGLRHVQLIFLQLISPMAIMSYISPKKDGMFQKWLKQFITTYVDLFIRIFILYFMFYVISALGQELLGDGMQNNGEDAGGLMVFLFVLMGLLMFMKRVPKLMAELFPSGGAASIGFGFSGQDRKGILGDAYRSAMSATARTAGAIAGVARAGKGISKGTLLKDLAAEGKNLNKRQKFARYAKAGATYANTVARAGHAGWKAGKEGKIGDAIRAGQEKVQGYEAIVAAGGSVLGHDYRPGHYQNEQVRLQVQLDLLKKMGEAKSSVTSSIGEIKFRKQMDDINTKLQTDGTAEAKLAWSKNIKKFEELARKYATGTISGAEYVSSVNSMISSFETTHKREVRNPVTGALEGYQNYTTGLNTNDLELDQAGKYSAINTRMNEAEKIAKQIDGNNFTYTVMEEKINERTGEVITDEMGRPVREKVTKTLKLDTSKSFAESMSEFVDNSVTTSMQIETSDDYKVAKVNSEGKK